MEDKSSILHYYKKLIEFRKNSYYSDCIIYGDYELLFPEDERLFSYIRSNDDYRLLILCNYSDEVIEPNIISKFKSGDILLSNYGNNNHDLKKLKPFEALVIKLDN
jgi:glycosidase